MAALTTVAFCASAVCWYAMVGPVECVTTNWQAPVAVLLVDGTAISPVTIWYVCETAPARSAGIYCLVRRPSLIRALDSSP